MYMIWTTLPCSVLPFFFFFFFHQKQKQIQILIMLWSSGYRNHHPRTTSCLSSGWKHQCGKLGESLPKRADVLWRAWGSVPGTGESTASPAYWRVKLVTVLLGKRAQMLSTIADMGFWMSYLFLVCHRTVKQNIVLGLNRTIQWNISGRFPKQMRLLCLLLALHLSVSQSS